MDRKYLLHSSVATRQLLPEVGDVVVVLFQVLLEVVSPEGQQRFLHLGVELWKQRAQINTVRGLGEGLGGVWAEAHQNTKLINETTSGARRQVQSYLRLRVRFLPDCSSDCGPVQR